MRAPYSGDRSDIGDLDRDRLVLGLGVNRLGLAPPLEPDPAFAFAASLINAGDDLVGLAVDLFELGSAPDNDGAHRITGRQTAIVSDGSSRAALFRFAGPILASSATGNQRPHSLQLRSPVTWKEPTTGRVT